MIIVVRKTLSEAVGRIRGRFRSRGLEWEHALVMLLFGMIVLCNPAVFDGPSFSAFPGLPAWLPLRIDRSDLWGTAMFVAGSVRVAALCINGYLARPTAIFRAIGAIIGIVMFSAVTLGLLFSGTLPTGLAAYGVPAVFGLFSLSWAVFDVAIPDDHDDHTP